MRKLLKLLVPFILLTSFTLTVTGCYNPLVRNSNDDSGHWKPPASKVKDIKYYQELIEKTKIDVANCQEWIKEIKENWENDQHYQMMIDQISAGLYTYQSEINEYQYQILLLEKGEDEFSSEQILQGIEILTEKITNLEQALKIEEKYPNDYPESELIKNRNSLKEAKEIKKMFLKLKEENEKEWEN